MRTVVCFEGDAKHELEIPPALSKAFMDEAIDHIKSGRDYKEALEVMAEKSGLQPDTINQILKRDPKVFSITKQTIAKAGRVRAIRSAADAFAGDLKNDAQIYQPGKIAKAWDLQRRIALAGHSVVFPWSHMRNWTVQIPTRSGIARMKAFYRAAGDVWRYGGEKGRALHEMDTALMQMGDRYDFWKQATADIDPTKRTPGDMLLQSRKPSMQTRNFDTLKMARYTNLEDIWNHLDPKMREGDAGQALATMLARDMNYATGSIMPPKGMAANPLSKAAAALSDVAGRYNLALSSKLFFGKHMDGWLGPLRYLFKTGRMLPEERAAANVALKRWANTVTAHLAILGVNAAFNKMMGWPLPSFNPNEPREFLRVRLGNHVVPFSPILEAIRLPILSTAAFVKAGPGEGGKRVALALWNAAHPAFHTLAEQTTGKDYQGRPVPSVRGLIESKGKSFYVPSKKPEVSGGEYLGTRLTPIAISGAIKEYYQALRDQGVQATLAVAIIKGLAAGAGSAVVGMHGFEVEPTQPKPAPAPKSSFQRSFKNPLKKGGFR